MSLLDAIDPLPDVAVCVVGLLGRQRQCQRDAAAAERVMRTNYVGPTLLMGALAERFEERGSGTLVGVNSVAEAVTKAIHRQRDIIYGPRIWRLIMLVVRAVPERLFKRTTPQHR